MEAKVGDIPRGTIIATFNKEGKYPNAKHGNHVAIYLSHGKTGITVLHQYNTGTRPGIVHESTIPNQKLPHMDSMDADWYYVVE